ncbi:hypothetical protein JOL62DRAFT_257465 [Phyllosticta paracitricarpa]|uniref:Uncharacterized protein n=1 Tax=Phyllosticta paracitricarpa TaxID=2016321 RepID=A0ABR1MZA0_9PEZI
MSSHFMRDCLAKRQYSQLALTATLLPMRRFRRHCCMWCGEVPKALQPHARRLEWPAFGSLSPHRVGDWQTITAQTTDVCRPRRSSYRVPVVPGSYTHGRSFVSARQWILDLQGTSGALYVTARRSVRFWSHCMGSLSAQQLPNASSECSRRCEYYAGYSERLLRTRGKPALVWGGLLRKPRCRAGLRCIFPLIGQFLGRRSRCRAPTSSIDHRQGIYHQGPAAASNPA